MPASTPVATATATLKPSTFQSIAIQVGARDECGRGGQDLPNEDHAETDAGGGAGDGDQRALGEVAQRELAPRRPERDADRRLAGADDGSRQQQRRHVGAGNEQQEACAGEQDQQRGADGSADVRSRAGRPRLRCRTDTVSNPSPRRWRPPASRPPAPVPARPPVCGGRTRSTARLPRFASVGDGTNGIHTSVSPRAAQAGDRQPERRRHDAAHGIGPTVERDGAADDVAPAAKAPPEALEMTALVSSANHWPRSGGPSCRASAGVTAAPGTNCGSPGAVRWNRPARNQPNASKLVVCCW